MLLVGTEGAVSWPSCLGAQLVLHQGRGPTGREAAALPPHSPGGQASPAGQVSHCDREERLWCLLKVPAGQVWVWAWGLEEPTGHMYL